jgi:ribosomal protein S18 acetylase RimI-like enzyme
VGGQRVPFRKEANGTWIPVPASANTAPSGESPPTAKPLVPNKEPPPETSPRKSSRPKTALSTRFGLLTELTSQRVFGKPMSVEDFEEAVSAPEGYQAQLESLERAEWKGHPALRMHIRVHDEDGNEAGEAIRYLYKNGKETHAHHFHIEIDSEHQRKGISNALLRSSFGFYQKHGVKQVNLQAALSGGRYAWARLGFSPDAEAENEVDDVRPRRSFAARNGVFR